MAQQIGRMAGMKQDRAKMTKAQARRLLTSDDKKALPFLGKKCKDKNSPDFGRWQEDRIVQHINDRLMLSDLERMVRIQRMEAIDIQLSGVVKLDKEDAKRDRNNKKGKAPKPTKHNLALAYTQLDDIVTYCMSLFAPEANIFIATSTADKQSVATALTNEIGKHGQTLQYYRNFCKFLINTMKYNLGALSCNWEQCTGKVFASQNTNNPGQQQIPSGQIEQVKGTVWEGNVLRSVDMYNFLYDTSVHPVDLPLRGEYYAEVELQTPFRIKRMANQNILYGISRYIDTVAPLSNTINSSWYRSPPIVRDTMVREGGTTNWQQVLSAGGPGKSSQLSIELVWYTTWVVPSEYDLSESNELECWRLCMANGKYITAGYNLDITHGQLPVSCGSPIEDDLQNNQRTYAEMLLPLQNFASFLLNTHVDATRKAIYGITVFDKTAFAGLDLDTEDLIGARIPMKSVQGMDIDKLFRHYNDAPQTDQNVEMVEKIVQLMQKILPTNQAQQVADLERATEYQAAATVQAGSKRNLKIARIINDQAITPIKFQMMYNIYQNVTVIDYIDEKGEPVKITPSQILDAALEFDVGTGLKGLDRLMQISIFKDLMGYLFQVKGMNEEVDLLALLSYVCEIAGFKTDLSRFRIGKPGAANQETNPNAPAGTQPPPANIQQGGSSAPAIAA